MYIATYSIDLAALAYLIWLLKTSTALNDARKKPFLAGITLTIVIILSEAGTVMASQGSDDLRVLNIICNILGFALTPVIPVAITMIFNKKILNSHRYLLWPTLINILAAVLSPFFRFIFYVDRENNYFRGDFFLVFVAVYIINFLILLSGTLDVGKQHNYPILRKLIALSLFTIMGTSIQLAYPSVFSSWHCVTLSLFLYYILLSEFDSSFDTLTGLYNRAAFDKAAGQKVKARPFSLIILDIDEFKRINDTYGHDYGDAILKTVSAIIRDSFKKHYSCYRYGGDEFSIIGQETDRDKIEFNLRLMTQALSAVREKGRQLPTVSFGYSIYQGDDNLDFYQILQEADEQMYHYKNVHKQTIAGQQSFFAAKQL